MSEPSISVVIPTYNRSASLSITLTALLRQTRAPETYEVVVVSDGSTDDTASVVEMYKSQAKNSVTFIQQKNAGPSVARNRGIAAATNDLIVFLDDDVEPVPGFLNRHAAAHADSNRKAVIGPMSPDTERRNSEPAWITWEHEKLSRVYKMFQPGGQYPTGEGGPMHFYSGNASVYRSWLVELGGFDTRYSRQEDVELAVRLSKSFGIRFYFEFRADGIHRPGRSFESWLKIPREYGRLDALRLAEGTVSPDLIKSNSDNRHALSKLIVAITDLGPAPAQLVTSLLRSAALTSSNLHLRRPALLLLSALYNASYNQAFRAEQTRQKRSVGQSSGRNRPTPTGTAAIGRSKLRR